MRRSMRWAERCRAAFRARPGYGLFGIVQGSTDPELRLESAARLVEIGFDGYAIGGLAVGEGQALMLETVALTAPALPADRPRYLMGVGRPRGSGRRGRCAGSTCSTACCRPAPGRTAQAWTRGGPLNLRNARHADDPRPLDPACACPVCALHSRAYLHHLVRAGEILAAILLTSHNLFHYQALMAALRTAIERGELADLDRRLAAERAGGDLAPWPGAAAASAGLTPPPD